MARGPVEVQAGCESALAALSGAFATCEVTGSREQWAGAVGSLQRVIDVASAAQDAAIARLAAIEPELVEDGTVVESHRGLGHVALDAPALLSGVLSVSAVHAQRRVRTAVRLAADGPPGSVRESGLGALHAAMGAGRLDSYRAAVLADELEHAPAEVAATVLTALQGHFEGEDGAHLRRRCRRVLARISPDLLAQRARRARSQCGLRRWAEEPGVDRWEGTFPSEEAARAWAAIDALAHRYLEQQVCPNIERARAKALTDLVAGNATIDTVLTVTVAATVLPEAQAQVEAEGGQAPTGGEQDLVEVTGLSSAQPVLVSRRWLACTADGAGTVQVVPCHPVTGALHAMAAGLGADRYRPGTRLAEGVRARDRRCRFPGCTIAAVFCDLDHVRPWPGGRTRADNLICLCRRHHRIKQRPGWHVALAPDGVATWTDPTGRVRTTMPVDALHPTVLPGRADPAGAPASTSPPSRARTVLPDGPHSQLEYLLEHLSAAPPPPATTWWRDHHHRRHRTDLNPSRGPLVLDRPGHWPHRRTRPHVRGHDTDPPPF